MWSRLTPVNVSAFSCSCNVNFHAFLWWSLILSFRSKRAHTSTFVAAFIVRPSSDYLYSLPFNGFLHVFNLNHIDCARVGFRAFKWMFKKYFEFGCQCQWIWLPAKSRPQNDLLIVMRIIKHCWLVRSFPWTFCSLFGQCFKSRMPFLVTPSQQC